MATLNSVGSSVAPWGVPAVVFAYKTKKCSVLSFHSYTGSTRHRYSLQKKYQRYITDVLRHASSARAKHCLRLTSAAARLKFLIEQWKVSLLWKLYNAFFISRAAWTWAFYGLQSIASPTFVVMFFRRMYARTFRPAGWGWWHIVAVFFLIKCIL